MTFEALYKQCQRKTGNRSSEALIGFQECLNIGQGIVAGSLDNWRELQDVGTLTLSDGTESYSVTSLDSNFVRFRSDVILITSPTNDETAVHRVSSNRLREWNPVTTNDGEGTPQWWYEDPSDDTKIKFYPIPDQTYTATADIIISPSDMSTASDTPFFPGRWHHILVDYALAEHYESSLQPNFDKATFHRTKFINGLRSLISDYRQRFIGQQEIDYSTGVNE